jgi:hypothetical protein
VRESSKKHKEHNENIMYKTNLIQSLANSTGTASGPGTTLNVNVTVTGTQAGQALAWGIRWQAPALALPTTGSLRVQ